MRTIKDKTVLGGLSQVLSESGKGKKAEVPQSFGTIVLNKGSGGGINVDQTCSALAASMLLARDCVARVRTKTKYKTHTFLKKDLT